MTKCHVKINVNTFVCSFTFRLKRLPVWGLHCSITTYPLCSVYLFAVVGRYEQRGKLWPLTRELLTRPEKVTTLSVWDIWWRSSWRKRYQGSPSAVGAKWSFTPESCSETEMVTRLRCWQRPDVDLTHRHVSWDEVWSLSGDPLTFSLTPPSYFGAQHSAQMGG